MRFDNLTPGSVIEIQTFYGAQPHEVETAAFLGIYGEGDGRNAKLATVSKHPKSDGTHPIIEWEIYRYNGRWAYGTSADRISLVRVIAEPTTVHPA